MLGEVLGVERRRRWSEDEKLEILLEVGVGGASVTQVAQRHEITRSQIYGWRRDLKKKGLWSPDRGAVFLPVDFGEAQTPASAPVPARPVPVELRLSNGRCLRFDSSMDGEALTRLIRAVDAA
jgi:transposase